MKKYYFLVFFFILISIYPEEKLKIIIGCDNNFPPYEFTDNEGQPTGYDIDLIKEISKEMNFDIEIKTGTWEEMIKLLNEKKIDVITGMVFSKSRDKIYDFTVPQCILYLAIFNRSDEPDLSESDLAGKNIILQNQGFAYEYFKSKNYNITGVNNPENALQSVSQKLYDCTISNRYTGLYLIKKNKLKNIKISGNILDGQKFCFAALNENMNYISIINEGLFLLKDKGKFREINDKWFGVLEPAGMISKNFLMYFYIFMIILAFIAILVFFWLFSLKRRVEIKTKELKNELAERKKIEAALLESELLFSIIFKKFPNPMSINDESGKYLDINEYFEIYTGFKKEEVIGKTTVDLGIFESEAARNLFISKFMENKEINNHELNLFTKDKKMVTGLASSVMVKIKGENIVFNVFNDITERKKLEKALIENEERFRMMFEDSPLGIFQTRYDQKIIYINNSFARILGYDSVEDAKRNLDLDISTVYAEENCRNEIIRQLNASPDGKVTLELELFKKDKSRIIVLAFYKKVYDELNNIYMLEGFIEDITMRKNNETKLKDSLHEKEILLKEIHHRVKNNLQIISSLLNLQQNYLQNKEDAKIFQDSQNRVKSMAIIHEKLYESKDLSRVDLKDYVESLVHYLYLSYGIEYNRIEIDMDIDDIFLEIEKSISFGILLNELLSNCFKHAFPEERKGKILIRLKKSGNSLILKIKDNGPGLPENFRIDDTNSLGLKLVSNLTIQLNGKIEIENINGASFTIIFKE